MGSGEKALGLAHRGEILTSHNIPEVDEAVSPSGGQEAAIGAKTNSIDLGEVGVLWEKGRLGPLVLPTGAPLRTLTGSLTRTCTHQVSSALRQPPAPLPIVPCLAS